MFKKITELLIMALIFAIPIQLSAQDLFELFESIEDSSEVIEDETDYMGFSSDSISSDAQSDLFSGIEQQPDSSDGEPRNFTLGMNLGGQLFNGDIAWTNVGWSEAFEVFFKLPLSRRFFISPSIGYGSLSDGTFHIDKSHFYTSMYTFDVKFGANLFSIGDKINSFFYLGLGLMRFKCERDDFLLPDKRESATSIFSGGGFEYQLNPKLSLFLSGDYRFTNSDALEGFDNSATAKDGYANLRFGVNYSFGKKESSDEDKVLAELVGIEEGFSEETEEDLGFDDFAEGIEEAEAIEEEHGQVDQLVKLKARLEKLNDQIRQKEAEITELKSQLEYKAKKLEELQQQVQSGTFQQAVYRPVNEASYQVASNVDVGEFSISYEEALRLFYERDYAQGIAIFSSLLEVYPNHRLASNCQYWIGECYYGLGNYEAAIQSFQNIFSYDQSSKYDDSLLMIARCCFGRGDQGTAREYLEQLLQDFPESEYSAIAESYLRSL